MAAVDATGPAWPMGQPLRVNNPARMYAFLNTAAFSPYSRPRDVALCREVAWDWYWATGQGRFGKLALRIENRLGARP
jgi:hypothetical protein